jgi:hypothetical protein
VLVLTVREFSKLQLYVITFTSVELCGVVDIGHEIVGWK